MLLIVILALVFGRPFAELGTGLEGQALLLAMGAVFVVDVIMNVIWLVIRPRTNRIPKGWQEMIENGWGFLIAVVVFIGPLLEELVFRYFLVGSLYDVSPTLAIGLSGVLFGLVHSRNAFVKILMGGMYAWLYAASGTLLVPLVMHMFWNAGVLLIARKSINANMPAWRRW